MPDVFISYASVDEGKALTIRDILMGQGLSAFVAKSSLEPGASWSDEIQNALRSARTILILASKAACSSGFVQQEAGFAVIDRKLVIPIVWDMDPGQLPGWLALYQAIDLRNATPAERQGRIETLAQSIRSKEDRKNLFLIVGGVALAFLIAR